MTRPDEWEVAVSTGGPEVVDSLAADWDDLVARSEDQLPFTAPGWVRAYAAHFAPELRIVTVRRAGRLKALLPLVRERVRFAGLPARRLHGASSIGLWRFDVVRAAGEPGHAALAALARFLGRHRGWDVLQLPDTPAGGGADELLRLAAEGGHGVGRVESMRTPYLSLAGWDGSTDWWLKRVSGNFRSVLRRAIKRAGDVRLERIERADPAAFARFLELEGAGWKGAHGNAIAKSPVWLSYFRALTEAAGQRGSLVFHFLANGQGTIAAQLGVVYRGRYCLLKTAHDEALRNLAPGHLITLHALNDCAARGLLVYDFIAKDDEWKLKWTQDLLVHSISYVFRKGLYGRALRTAKFQLNAAVKRLLGRSAGNAPRAA